MSTPIEPRLLAVAAVVVLGALTFLPLPMGLLALAGVLALGIARRSPDLVHLGLIWGVLNLCAAVPGLPNLWPLTLLLGLGASWALARGRPALAGPWEGLRLGHITRRDLAWGLAFALTSGMALVLWFRVMAPDVSDLLARLPAWPRPALLGLGILFATANGLAEELAFRGVLMGALDRSLGRRWSLVLQAVIFGLMHWNGFPRGPVGVVLAAVYGGMMGIIRRRADGLAASWFSHVLTDAVIFAILISQGASG